MNRLYPLLAMIAAAALVYLFAFSAPSSTDPSAVGAEGAEAALALPSDDLAAVLPGEEEGRGGRAEAAPDAATSLGSGEPAAGPLVAQEPGARVEVELVGEAVDHPEATPGEGFTVYGSVSDSPLAERRIPELGENGRLVFSGVQRGELYFVGLEAPLFIDAVVQVPATTPGEVYTISLPVRRGVAAAGTVKGPDGAPLAGAEVRLGSWDRPDLASSIGYQEEAVTDDEGRFTVGGVLPGAMTLRVSKDGFDSAAETLGERGEGEFVEGLALRLAHGGRIAGTVRWSSGEPAAGATLSLAARGRSWKGAKEAKADGEGAFEFTGLGPGSYRVAAKAKKKRTRAESRALEIAAPGDEVLLTLGKGHSLAGRVLDDLGQPIKDFRVSAVPVGDDAGGDTASARVRRGEGSFELTGMQPGVFDVTATAKGYAKARPVRVTVPDASAAPDLVLDRLASAAGVVVDTADAPKGNAKLVIGGRGVTTDDEGRFEVDRVEPGALLVQVSDASLGLVRSEPPIVAPGERREDVVIVLGAGGSVRCRLHGSLEGGIHTGATIRRESSYGMSGEKFDESGEALFTGLEPGRYYVALPKIAGVEWVDSFKDMAQVPVDVAEGEEALVTVGDPAAYPILITGSVTRGGDAQPGLLIYVYERGDEKLFPAVIGRTDDEGRYGVRLRTPGTYTFNVGEGQQAQARFEIGVTDASVQEHDFALPDRTLRGRATLADGAPVIGRGYVLVHADAPPDTKQGGDLQFASTRRDGSFTFTGLHAGTYRLHTGNYFQAHDTDGLVVVEDVVVPEVGEADELEVTVPEAATVMARAMDGSGEPLGGCVITLETSTGAPHHFYPSAKTDSQGYMRLVGVGPGRWLAKVRREDGQVLGEAAVDVAAGSAQDLVIVCGP